MHVRRLTITELMAQAQRRLARLGPWEAAAAAWRGALLIDIRSEFHREREGVIPDAVFVPRNVLEWRLDPESGASEPALSADLDRHIVLVCREGFQSSLAASTLLDLGFTRATDLDGGFLAWQAAGLPVDPGDQPSVAESHSLRNAPRGSSCSASALKSAARA